MANFNSDIATAPARAPRFNGVIARRAKIQIPTGLAASDTLTLFKLPKSAVVLSAIIYNDDAGGTITADLGYLGGTIDSVAEDPNAFGAALALGTAGRIDLDEAAGFIDLGPLDAERAVALTVTTATSPTVGADIVCVMNYLLSA
jgi:hypothetical protein